VFLEAASLSFLFDSPGGTTCPEAVLTLMISAILIGDLELNAILTPANHSVLTESQALEEAVHGEALRPRENWHSFARPNPILTGLLVVAMSSKKSTIRGLETLQSCPRIATGPTTRIAIGHIFFAHQKFTRSPR